MSVVTAILLGLAMGAAFGLALEKSRVFEPGIILGQMQMRSFIMLKVFLTAVTTGLVVMAALNGFGIIRISPKAAVWGADVAGGLLLGAGITLAGGCPGTVWAQIGAGYRDAWFTLAGGILGAIAFTYAEPALRPFIQWGASGRITLATETGAPFWMLALGLAAILVACLVALERWRPWQGEIGAQADGLLPQDGEYEAAAPIAPPRTA